MGRELPTSDVLPLLWTGITLACVQAIGTVPWVSDDWKIMVRYLATHWAYSYRNSFGMLSGPGDFLVFMHRRRFSNTSSLIRRSDAGGRSEVSVKGRSVGSCLVKMEEKKELKCSIRSWVALSSSALCCFFVGFTYLQNLLGASWRKFFRVTLKNLSLLSLTRRFKLNFMLWSEVLFCTLGSRQQAFLSFSPSIWRCISLVIHGFFLLRFLKLLGIDRVIQCIVILEQRPTDRQYHHLIHK